MNKLSFVISVLLLSAGLVTLINCTSPEVATDEVKLTVITSLERIGQDEPLYGESQASVKAAKNEYEPFQVILRSQENLKKLDVVVSDLVGSDGRKIGKENIALYREHYVHVCVPSYRCDNPPGWYPDALIPFVDPATGEGIDAKETRFVAAPFDLWAGQNQVIWVDVFVPKDAAAGDYAGRTD